MSHINRKNELHSVLSVDKEHSQLFCQEDRHSIKSFETQVREMTRGRSPLRESARRMTNGHPVENIDEVLEAIELVQELAEGGEELLESESLYKWLTEVARVYFEGNEENPANADEAEEQPSPSADSLAETPYTEGENELLDDWLEDNFVQDLAAKIQGRNFVGGADEVDVIPTSVPCSYCNKPIGDERDQHVLKCENAHEEQERLDWMLRRGEVLRGRTRK